MTGSHEHTVEELAELGGVPARTIRFYQTQGALPPPLRRGRQAFYDDDHVERLKLIGVLRDRGLRLDAITAVLTQLDSGGNSLQEWLGVAQATVQPWVQEPPVLVTADELRRRCGGDDEVLDEVVRAGIARREDGFGDTYYLLRSPTLVDAAVALVAVGVEPSISGGSAAIIRAHLAAMADQLVAYYVRAFHEQPRLDGDTPNRREVMELLRDVGFTTVRKLFAHEIERQVQRAITQGPALFAGATGTAATAATAASSGAGSSGAGSSGAGLSGTGSSGRAG